MEANKSMFYIRFFYFKFLFFHSIFVVLAWRLFVHIRRAVLQGEKKITTSFNDIKLIRFIVYISLL